ncbi:MAG: carbon storage regulator CsrA [Pseudomonadota bacterium]|nr:carbon storage regulator CsrA [Pseudomonadota bacterium]
MLVLTRRENESLIIGDNIKLTILAVKGGQVRVGIEAPNEIPIHREELLIDAEDLQKAVTTGDLPVNDTSSHHVMANHKH